jgi:hypothetical protein
MVVSINKLGDRREKQAQSEQLRIENREKKANKIL